MIYSCFMNHAVNYREVEADNSAIARAIYLRHMRNHMQGAHVECLELSPEFIKAEPLRMVPEQTEGAEE